MPSQSEGFPRVLYEAMAFGLPIVTTFVGSIPTIMQDKANCLRIEVGSAASIAGQLHTLLTNPNLHSTIAWAGYYRISELLKTWHRSHAVQVAEKIRDLSNGVAHT
jgi:glycosyltransferase involved in cell wall biosynthesis